MDGQGGFSEIRKKNKKRDSKLRSIFNPKLANPLSHGPKKVPLELYFIGERDIFSSSLANCCFNHFVLALSLYLRTNQGHLIAM